MTKIELPPLAEQVAHVHSNGDFCAERQITATDWPVNLFTAEQTTAYALLAVEQERERIIEAIETLRPTDERTVNWTSEMFALNDAIDKLAAAIRQSATSGL